MAAVLVPVLAMLVLAPVPVPAVLEPAVLLVVVVPVLRRRPQQPRLSQ